MWTFTCKHKIWAENWLYLRHRYVAMATLDCNKTEIIRNFHLYIILLWKTFFHISTHGDVVNAQT